MSFPLIIRSLSLSVVFLTACVHGSFAQCSLADDSRDALFITFERTAEVKLDGREKLQPGVVLRLHNNSTCAVLIETGSAEKFYKPLPPNPKLLQRLRREIDHELPNGALVPEIQYRYHNRKTSGVSVGGDVFFWFKLMGDRSVLFEVPLSHLDVQAAGIELRFRYDWEHSNRAQTNHASTENIVRFGSSGLPEDVKRQIEIKRR